MGGLCAKGDHFRCLILLHFALVLKIMHSKLYWIQIVGDYDLMHASIIVIRNVLRYMPLLYLSWGCITCCMDLNCVVLALLSRWALVYLLIMWWVDVFYFLAFSKAALPDLTLKARWGSSPTILWNWNLEFPSLVHPSVWIRAFFVGPTVHLNINGWVRTKRVRWLERILPNTVRPLATSTSPQKREKIFDPFVS